MNTYTILLPYFGAGRYLPLLNRTIKGLKGAGTKHDVAVLTDKDTPWDALPDDDAQEVVRVDTTHYRQRYTRPSHGGEAFDYKSCLIMSALDRPTQSIGLGRRAIVMDIDNAVLKNFDDVVEVLSPYQMGMAECPEHANTTLIPANAITGRPLVEMTSAFMVFPVDARALMISYRSMWDRAAEGERDHPLLEQRTWSLVWHTAPARCTLPRTMSWSRMWGMPPPPETFLHHQHGAEKWEGL